MCALLFSCGASKHGNDISDAQTGASFSTEVKSLNFQSVEVAYKICNAFRSKRNYWHAQPVIGMTANISFGYTDCDSDTADIDIASIIKGPLLSSPMVFDSLSSENYDKEVQTDLHGDLRTVCPTILAGSTPLEFISSGSDRIYTTFVNVSPTLDRFSLIHAKLNDDKTSYISDEVIVIDVLTSTTDDKLLGTVTSTTTSKVCGENKTNETSFQFLDSIL
ncbi:hypothetical protein A9Q84_17545 [Halobacteriovorax marinus]|uniref:Uncharacterized protein n=1 Tax=Halobacteriovorax marinus TaxID=97084 RepID=A0A1Y5F358_9BACT|nr:hypothetical protein A9Q84_17545 [Halobacteriovorax marinus]